MERIGASKARTHLSGLLDLVARGESVTITRHGKPVTRLVPAPGNRSRAHEATAQNYQTPPGDLTICYHGPRPNYSRTVTPLARNRSLSRSYVDTQPG